MSNKKETVIMDEKTIGQKVQKENTMNENIETTVKNYDHVLKQAPDNVLLQKAVEKCNREQPSEVVANARFAVAIRDGLTKDELRVAKECGLTPSEYKKGGNQ